MGDLNKSISVKGTDNSLTEWVQERMGPEKVETKTSVEEFYCKGQQRNEATSEKDVKSREFFSLPDGRL